MDAMEASIEILKFVMSGESFEKLDCNQKCELAIENFEKIYNVIRNCTPDKGCQPDRIPDIKAEQSDNCTPDGNCNPALPSE